MSETPEGQLALLLGLLAATSAVPVWLGCRARLPSNSERVLEVPFRPWVGRLMRLGVPGAFITAGAGLVIALARLGGSLAATGNGVQAVTGTEWAGVALGAGAGVLIALPFLTLAWAWRRLMGAGVSATEEGVFAFGRFLPWERLEIEPREKGLILVDRTATVFRRQLFPTRTFRMDPALLTELRGLQDRCLASDARRAVLDEEDHVFGPEKD